MRPTAAGYVCDVNAKHLEKSPNMQRYYAEDICMLSVTAAILEEMKAQEISKVELANRIGKGKAFVSQVLNGSRNMTLKTLADFAWALGLEIRGIELRPIGTTTVSVEAVNKWLDCWPEATTTVEHSSNRETNWGVVEHKNLALVA